MIDLRVLFGVAGVMCLGSAWADGGVQGSGGERGVVVVKDLVDTRIEGISAEKLIIENCRRVYVGKNSVRRIEVKGGERVKIEGNTMTNPLSERDVFIEVWDSPGFVAAHQRLTGAGILVWDSPRAKVVSNTIDISGNRKEGIHFRGCDDFLISGNKVTGKIDGPEEGRSNDMIQVGPTTKGSHPRGIYPFPWGPGDREFVIFRPPNVGPGWTVFSERLIGGPNAGKTCYWAFETSKYVRGGEISNNEVSNGGIAGIFAWNVIGVKIVNNKGRNFRDYTFGVEWGIDCVISGNEAVQEERYRQSGGTNGGVAIMHFSQRNRVEDNVLQGCNVWIVPWGMIQLDNVVVRNRITRGGINLSYAATPVAKNVTIDYNEITQGFISVFASPFYTTGSISYNVINGGRSDNKYAVTVEAFKGTIAYNRVNGDVEFPIRVYNNGTYLPSIISERGNTADGQPIEVLRTGKGG